jgi:hypothetical protein
MMEEYQKETTRTLLWVLAAGALLFAVVSLSSCTGTGHTTHSSGCPAYSINETNYDGTCEI